MGDDVAIVLLTAAMAIPIGLIYRYQVREHPERRRTGHHDSN